MFPYFCIHFIEFAVYDAGDKFPTAINNDLEDYLTEHGMKNGPWESPNRLVSY